MTLDEFLTNLRDAYGAVSAEDLRLLAEAGDALVPIVQGEMHRRTGNMIAATGRFGPYPVAGGIFAVRVESGATYATYEAERGGEHDWPTRSLKAAQPVIVDLVRGIEDGLVRILTEGR